MNQPETPKCRTCGCSGNKSCGHEPILKDCALDQTLECGCCTFEKDCEKI